MVRIWTIGSKHKFQYFSNFSTNESYKYPICRGFRFGFLGSGPTPGGPNGSKRAPGGTAPLGRPGAGLRPRPMFGKCRGSINIPPCPRPKGSLNSI